MPRLAAIILAAGAGRRLGGRKPLAVCAGETLLARAARSCRDAGLEGTIAVFGATGAEFVEAATDAALPFTVNANWHDGMGTSIAAGVAALPDDCDAVLLRTVDQVLVDADGWRELIAAWRQAPDAISAARYAGTTGVPAIFPRRCFAALGALRGDRGARGLLSADDDVVAVDLPAAALDVDTAADLVRAEAALLSRARAGRSARS
jgi:CTP:molybdopterin cytidylyltransferase MocA